ncbi:proline transporter 2-like [Fagus crenata]
MDTGAETNINGGDFSTEQGQNHENGVTSAHTIDHDSWQQVGLLLTEKLQLRINIDCLKSNVGAIEGWTWPHGVSYIHMYGRCSIQ